MNIRKLKADEIECRINTTNDSGCSLLLYKTARTDRAILDEIAGDFWQNDFKVIDGKMYGGIGIYNKDLKDWLWRWDCGTESNTEKEKGEASDCFKRAGFKWGIGIELYSAPFIWVNIPMKKNEKGKYEPADKYAKFSVKEISYDDNGNIKNLEIVNNKKETVYKTGDCKQKTQAKEPTKQANNDAGVHQLIAEAKTVENLKKVYETYLEKVTDRKTFASLVNARKKELMKGQENE